MLRDTKLAAGLACGSLAASAELEPEEMIAELALLVAAATTPGELVEQYQTALVDGDAEAAIVLVAADAPSEFSARLENGVLGLSVLGATRISVELVEPVIDLSPPQLGSDRVVYAVDRRYQIPQFDSTLARDRLYWTFLRGDDGWRLAADDDLRSVGLDSDRPLWDLTPVITTESPNFIIVTSTGNEARADQVSELTEQALVDLDETWVHPWHRRLLVVVPDDTEQLEEILQPTFDLDEFLAFVSFDRERSAGWDVTAPRMFLNDQRLSVRSEGFQVRVLVHELARAATVPLAGPVTPLWAHEGLAGWVAQKGSDASVGDRQELPRGYEFRTGGSAAITGSYEAAQAAFADVAALAGPTGPYDLFVSLGLARVAPGTVLYHVDRALTDVLSVGIEEFTETWRTPKPEGG